jgi:hypothetical protein
LEGKSALLRAPGGFGCDVSHCGVQYCVHVLFDPHLQWFFVVVGLVVGGGVRGGGVRDQCFVFVVFAWLDQTYVWVDGTSSMFWLCMRCVWLYSLGWNFHLTFIDGFCLLLLLNVF